MKDSDVIKDNMSDDRLIMDFIKKRNPDGARTAMRLHIIHAMEGLQKNQNQVLTLDNRQVIMTIVKDIQRVVGQPNTTNI